MLLKYHKVNIKLVLGVMFWGKKPPTFMNDNIAKYTVLLYTVWSVHGSYN